MTLSKQNFKFIERFIWRRGPGFPGFECTEFQFLKKEPIYFELTVRFETRLGEVECSGLVIANSSENAEYVFEDEKSVIKILVFNRLFFSLWGRTVLTLSDATVHTETNTQHKNNHWVIFYKFADVAHIDPDFLIQLKLL